MNTVEDFVGVVGRVGGLISSIDGEEWAADTPCDQWDVRAVVDHLLDVQRRFRGTMVGEKVPAETSWDDNVAVLVASFRSAGALERTVVTRLGAIPAAMALDILVMEHLGHGWDLGRAVGRMPAFDEAVVERTLRFSRAASAQLPPHLRNFKDPQPVPPGATVIDRLAALLGRTVPT